MLSFSLSSLCFLSAILLRHLGACVQIVPAELLHKSELQHFVEHHAISCSNLSMLVSTSTSVPIASGGQ